LSKESKKGPKSPDLTDLSERKSDHLSFATQSQTDLSELDRRFYYEPLLQAHPTREEKWPSFTFLGKSMGAPIWISSMTGGTDKARNINQNLAKAAKEFSLGMGLGSCRPLLQSEAHFEDFNLRPILGPHVPFYANLGMAQVEKLVQEDRVQIIVKLVEKLKADGLIIHVNPLQEYVQEEGDRFQSPPLETIKRVLDKKLFPIIVKEVGHGMGPQSLKSLMELPLEAIDFGAMGGTNFSVIEAARRKEKVSKEFTVQPLFKVGHSAEEMINYINHIGQEKLSGSGPHKSHPIECKNFIISGGVHNYLDGHFLMNSLKFPAIYGQAHKMLLHATGDYALLQEFITSQIQGLLMAKNFLPLRTLSAYP
jgi:isopentenyl-diphosphate delta-isomerase